jgi:hypothetical protein
MDDASDRNRNLPQPSPQSEGLCPWEPELTEEEIQNRIREPGGSTLAEFWNRLENASGLE